MNNLSNLNITIMSSIKSFSRLTRFSMNPKLNKTQIRKRYIVPTPFIMVPIGTFLTGFVSGSLITYFTLKYFWNKSEEEINKE